MKRLLLIISFFSLLTANKCADNPVNSYSDNTDLAIQLSNDSTFYLAENLVPLASPRHFDIDDSKIVYGIGNFIVMHDIDSSKQVGYIEIDHKKMDLAANNVYYRSFPYRDDSKLVSSKYVHEKHNISYEGIKTIMHNIEDIYINGNSIESAVNMSLYYELGNNTLSGSNTTTKLTYEIDKKKIAVETSNFDFLEDSVYFESHFFLLGDKEPNNYYSYSWGYHDPYSVKNIYPELFSILDTNGLFKSRIALRDSIIFDMDSKYSIDEWHEYDFEDDQYYLTTSFNDRIFTKHGDIIIDIDSNNNHFRKSFLDMGDNERKEYYNSKPYNYFINEIEVESNILKLLMTVPGVGTDNYLIQTYDVNSKKMIKQKYVDLEKFINVKFSKDLKHLYTLRLDEEADMYYIKKTEI